MLAVGTCRAAHRACQIVCRGKGRCRRVDAARRPNRHLLEHPDVAVGIVEGAKRPVARVLRIRAAEPCLRRKRCAVPHLTRLDATADEFVTGCLDIGDNQAPFGRARRGRSYSLAECDRARRTWGRELDDANALCWGDIGVEPPTQALVEQLGSLDVRDWDDVDLKLHVDSRDAGLILLLFNAADCLTHVILLSFVTRSRDLALSPWRACLLGPRLLQS